MRLAPLVLLATSLSASTSGVAPFTWIQGRMTYVVPDSDCHCLKADTGFGLGAGAWVAPRLGLEVEGLALRLTSKGGAIGAPEQHFILSGLFNLDPRATHWLPYLKVGVGDARVGTPYSLTSGTVNRLEVGVGAGLQYLFGQRGLASLEARSVSIDTDLRRTEYQAQLGLGLRWGGSRTPAPAPEPEPAAPAPAPEPAAPEPAAPEILRAPDPAPAPESAPRILPAPEPPAPPPLLDEATLHFANDQAVPSPESLAAIRQVAQSLKGYPGSYEVLITGYTSIEGSRDHNLALSLARAEEVAQLLVDEGVPRNKLRVTSRGPDQLLTQRRTRAGQAFNRRVEIQVQAPGAEIRHTDVEIDE